VRARSRVGGGVLVPRETPLSETHLARRTQREAHPESFMMTGEDIKHAPEVPTIPPLLSSG
jgi:hypothetical protein